jgi:hypothetical protein
MDALPVHATQDVREGHTFGGRLLRLPRSVATTGSFRVGEHLVAGVEDDVHSAPSVVPTFLGLRIIARQIISAASAGVIVGKRSYIVVGAIMGVRTNGM